MRKILLHVDQTMWYGYIENGINHLTGGYNYITINERNLPTDVYKAGWEAYKESQTELGMTVSVIDIEV